MTHEEEILYHLLLSSIINRNTTFKKVSFLNVVLVITHTEKIFGHIARMT